MPMLTEVKLAQVLKAPFPMVVTELGMVTVVKLVPLKALAPIVFTELGMLTAVTAGFGKNTFSPIAVTS